MQLVTAQNLADLQAHAMAGTLRRGDWNGRNEDGAEMACMMSALVSGAKSSNDCATAGWPKWLANLNVSLFDGAPDMETATRFSFDLAEACMAERDYDKARDRFLISRLEEGGHSALKTLSGLDGDFSQQITAVEVVVNLLRRRLDGENVAAEMKAAARAAADAARAVRAVRVAYAARAASYAADAAADAARATYAAADAAYAARAAARADLIAAIQAA